ncbi:MAG TPA: galactokinase family protein [Phycisphaerales bacterium]|nr:galactokinase family protein [Phycisphaerales bacterium]
MSTPAVGLTSLVAEARARLGEEFVSGPAFAAAAPGRVNLIGDHTDYNGGAALPLAIDRWCVAVAGRARSTPSAGVTLRCLAIDTGERAVLMIAPAARAEPAPPGEPGWCRYVREVARGLLGRARQLSPDARAGAPAPHRVAPVELAFTSTVPRGAGLASSAALELAVCTVLEQVWDLPLSPTQRRDLCWEAEHRAGVPCGLLDQTASAFGRSGFALLIDAARPAAEPRPVPMPPADCAAVLVADSGVRRALASGRYARLVRRCRRAAELLGVRDLCRAHPDALRCPDVPPTLKAVARHAIAEHARVLETARLLESAGPDTWPAVLREVGRHMLESHASLRDDYRVSCPELDTLVGTLAETPGVCGARLTGAGLGGCVVALVAPGAVGGADAALRHRFRARHGRECEVFTVTASPGASVIDSGNQAPAPSG